MRELLGTSPASLAVWIELLLIVLGALVYALASNPKAGELGRCVFWVSLLALLLR